VESVRAADANDAATVAEFLTALESELRPMRGGEVWARRDARSVDDAVAVTTLIADPEVDVVVGEIDGTPVGVGVMVVERLADGGNLARVSELFVLEAARSVGLGEAILGYLVTRARARGCSGIDAPALPGHRAAKNFFEDQGFTARLLTMHQEL
jgi:GNAT superfamily N-acetyltransferase